MKICNDYNIWKLYLSYKIGDKFFIFFFELLLYFINARLYLLYKHLYVLRFTIKVKNDEMILQKKFYYSRNQGN